VGKFYGWPSTRASRAHVRNLHCLLACRDVVLTVSSPHHSKPPRLHLRLCPSPGQYVSANVHATLMQTSGPCILSTGTSHLSNKAYRHIVNGCSVGASTGIAIVYDAVGFLQRAQGHATSMQQSMDLQHGPLASTSVKARAGIEA
jgi:hypothetical protein